MEIGLKIKEIAEKKNLSVIELAERIGRSRQAVYDIYTGKVSVNVDLLEKICLVLDIKMYMLFADESSLPQSKEELKKYIGKITDSILGENYIFITHIRQLIWNVHSNAKEGMGLVNLEINNKAGAAEYPFVEYYKPLKNPVRRQDLDRYQENILGGRNFFKRLLLDASRHDYNKIISDYVDENIK
jgi:XRE family transcriptional regulator, regulator of sulfur utilization